MNYSDEELLPILPRLLRADKAGRLFWLRRSDDMFTGKDKSRVCAAWNARFHTKEAFTAVGSDGYRRGGVFGRTYLAHRVVFALIFGRWPHGELDHKNHDGSDNRPVNLREVSHTENAKNCRLSRSNSTGVTGVYPMRSKWQAKIMIGGVSVCLGTFAMFGDAAAARKAAERSHGFHPNHGRRAA